MKKLNFHFKKLTKKQTLILILALILIASGGVAAYLHFTKQKTTQPVVKTKPVKKEEKKEPEKFYAALSGAQVDSPEKVNSPVIGVMIENSPNARPQSGLNEAEVVFEAIAEGGVTRFLALYQQNQPSMIGPVRSLRSYYLDWAWGFQASVAHVGGSGDALARIRDGQHRDLDQFFNSGTFWRATDRYAPHNVYTTFEKLLALNNSKGWTSSNFEGFARKEDTKSAAPTATKIQIGLSGYYYDTFYTYNADCNCYFRGQAGAAHLDREKGDITPRNIVALRMDMSRGGDGYHNVYSTIGSGTAVAFLDGAAHEISWEKASESSPLILKGGDGKNFQLNRGQTWLVAVPNSSGSIAWQ